MLSIDELLVALTEEQVFETFLSALETLGLPARSWKQGGFARTVLRVVARTYASFTVLIVAAIKSGFLETASGGWLTLLAYYVYGVTRISATFATGRATFTNTLGGVYSYNPEEITILWGTGPAQKAYVNTEAFSLNPGDVVSVAIRAVEQGSASSAPPGVINALQTTITGVTVTNPLSVVGTNEQTDEALRAQCINKLSTLSSLGPRGAYAYAVIAALRLDGSPVDINRMWISPSSSTGTVTIVCASPSGVPVADDLTAVRLSVENIARPDSVTATVLAANPVALSSAITVWAKSTPGIDAAGIEALVGAALVPMVAAHPIGGNTKPPSTQGYLFDSTIEGTAKAAHPSIYAVDGAVSLALAVQDVATLGTTITVRIVP